jgi:hypothetical protein
MVKDVFHGLMKGDIFMFMQNERNKLCTTLVTPWPKALWFHLPTLKVTFYFDSIGIIETTAAYVARSGPHFEDRIRENEKHNPRFCFLNPTDPYRAYYDFKIAEARGEGIFNNWPISQGSSKDTRKGH